MKRLIVCGLILTLILVPGLVLAAGAESTEDLALAYATADAPYLNEAFLDATAKCPTTVQLPTGSTVTCREFGTTSAGTVQGERWRTIQRTVDYRNPLGMIVITHTAIQTWLEETPTGLILYMAPVEQQFWSWIYRLLDSGTRQSLTSDRMHFYSTSWGRFGICIGDYCGNTVRTTITLTH